MSIIQIILSMVIFFILFFGIGFILNMVLRVSWMMAIVYPLVVLFIVNQSPLVDYFTQPGSAISLLFTDLITLKIFDIFILTAGFVGSILSGVVIIALRKNGYRMF